MRSDAPARAASASGSRPAAGLLFLHVPMFFILLYAFTTDDKSYQFPPPGLTLQLVRGRLGAPGHLERAVAVGAGRAGLDRARDRARHAGRGGAVSRPLLRPRGDHAADHPADRAARHRHRHLAARRDQPRRHPVQLLDHRGRPRDLLRRRGLQQRARPLPAHLRLDHRGVDGPRRRRLPDLPLRRAAEHRDRAAGRRHARLRALASTR